VTQAPQNTESTFLQLRWYHDKWDWVIATKDNIRCFFRGCSQLLYHWAMDPTLVDPCVYRLLNIMLMDSTWTIAWFAVSFLPRHKSSLS
jgi:hypothetical protein